MRMNVRCCCQPQKVLGTLEVPRLNADHFVVQERLSCSALFSLNTDSISKAVPTHEIKVRVFHDYSSGYHERAIYSDDRPLEFWRKIPGFIEAAEAA